MKETFLRSMRWLHTWVGLLVCWILFLVFFAGTLAYYQDEITYWMQPEVHQLAGQLPHPQQQRQLSNDAIIKTAITEMEETATASMYWAINLPSAREPVGSYIWYDKQFKAHRGYIDPYHPQQIINARPSATGEFLYRLHFDLHYISPILARWIIGFCAAFMLLAIVTGIVIHKRIFKDMFTFRPGKGFRSWLDGHNASAVLALPYHLMITYTGLVTLMAMYMPWGLATQYPDNPRQFYKEWNPTMALAPASGEQQRARHLDTILQQVHAHWPNETVGSVMIRNGGDKAARLTFIQAHNQHISAYPPRLTFAADSGKLIASAAPPYSSGRSVHSVLMALHTGNFANNGLRLLFFICGLSGCLMVASGALLWASKLRQQRAKQTTAGAHWGLALVDRLNLATFAGLPIATASYWFANRLLPVDLAGRAEWEVHTFFLSWLAVTAIACWRCSLRSWRNLFYIGAGLLALVPVVSMVTAADWQTGLGLGHPQLLAFDAMLWIMAAIMVLCGYQAGRRHTRLSTQAQGNRA